LVKYMTPFQPMIANGVQRLERRRQQIFVMPTSTVSRFSME
jgi:hypothetical protein